jgi:hypothetical protein
MEPEYDTIRYFFRVRRGELSGFGRSSSPPSLLIVDRSGVYSAAHRRYIRKTRYHRYRALATDLAPLVKAYRSLQKLGMNSWPENNEEARKEITWWKHWLMDAYWDAAPEKLKASAIERYYRERYQHGMVYPVLSLGVAVIVGGLSGFMLVGKFKASFDLLLLLTAFCLVAWVLVVITERFVRFRRVLSRSEIHDVLEFDLKSLCS